MTEAKSMIKYTIAVLFISFYVQGQFIDFSDLFPEDPLSLIWNPKNNLKNNQTCVVKDAMNMNVEGTCMHGVHCKKGGGTILGKGGCGHWQSCCVLDTTCNDIAEARVSYFRGFNNRLGPDATTCTYTVKLVSEDICQIRVDILSMTLAPATITRKEVLEGAVLVEKFSANCDQDNFYVSGAIPKNVKIPQICGTNNNQHFYIHLDRNQKLSRAVSLNLHISQNALLPAARWAIQVRQLACPTVQELTTTNIYTYLNHKKLSTETERAADFARLAPEGCLQYYTAPRGVIKSFGFNTIAETSLATDQDYAMCFKRTSGYCGVRFSEFDPIKLRTTEPNCNNEYIYVPEELDVNKKCTPDPSTVPPPTWISNRPGPLYIHYYAAKEFPVEDPQTGVQIDLTADFGFKFNYETNVPC